MRLDVEPTTIAGRWLRHAAAGLPPLPRREHPPDNRWQRGAVIDAIYLADSEATVWAEWYRHLAESGIPPNQALPRHLWTWEVDVAVADLSDEDRLRHVRLPLPVPGRSIWPRFQRVGERLWREGWAGLVAPSAARRAGLALCLFWDGEDEIAGARPTGRPRRISAPPAPPTGMTT